MTADDAGAAAALSGELGYPVSAEVMAQRIDALTGRPDHTVFVACDGERVVGWIDVGIVHHLQSDVRGEIGGFVVAGGYRSQGVGRQLILRAEQWARDRGLGGMIVRSQVAWEKAHRFYLREGYTLAKTSLVFTKAL